MGIAHGGIGRRMAHAARACGRRCGLLLAVILGVLGGARPAQSQQDLQPPNRFYGTLTVNGQPAPAGTTVTAIIGELVCGSRTTTEPGRYQIDVISSRERPGCGLPNATVTFRVGDAPAAETGTWAAGQFTRLNLTVGGGGAAQASSTDIARLDMESPCIPPPNQPACDENRRRLWAADPFAWAPIFAARGRLEPTPEEIFDEALMLRLNARDPAAQSALSRLMGWPHIRITALRFRGSAPRQADEWVEVSNLGGAPQDMAGFIVRARGSGAEYLFPAGFTLEPGASCRAYAAEPGPQACPGSFGRPGVWDDTTDTALLIYAPVDWTVDTPSYNAMLDRQPPPPNLRVR